MVLRRPLPRIGQFANFLIAVVESIAALVAMGGVPRVCAIRSNRLGWNLRLRCTPRADDLEHDLFLLVVKWKEPRPRFQSTGVERPRSRGQPGQGRRAGRAPFCTQRRKIGRRPHPPPQSSLDRLGESPPRNQPAAGRRTSGRKGRSRARKHAVDAGEVPHDDRKVRDGVRLPAEQVRADCLQTVPFLFLSAQD